MAFKTYNNNSNSAPVNSTFSSVSFSNPESRIAQSKFSIGYFNRLMKIGIALRNNAGSNDSFATYDTDNQVSVFVSFSKAKMLHDMIVYMEENAGKVHNVCVELKNGLLKISDGTEYGVNNPCLSISYADESGNVNEIIYETKTNYHAAAYNYDNGNYESKVFDKLELEALKMTLIEYYKASSYAIAASVMEASMYKRQAQTDLIKAIADKVGAQTGSGSSKGNFNNKTFLANNNSGTNANNGGLNGIPKEYEAATFDDIANGM